MSDDRPWLDGFRNGEPAALERTFRVYAPYALVILRRGFTASRGGYVNAVTDVDLQHDLLQEVFVRVLSPQVRQRYDGLRPFSVFLRGVVGNVMLEEARRQQKAMARGPVEPVELEDLPEAAPWTPGTPLPEQAAISQQERSLMQDYLATLTPEERRFVGVRFEEGVSQRDAADALGLGRHMVRTLETRIREGLRTFQDQWRRNRPPENPRT